jgi:hypothetical protein
MRSFRKAVALLRALKRQAGDARYRETSPAWEAIALDSRDFSYSGITRLRHLLSSCHDEPGVAVCGVWLGIRDKE